MVGKVMKLNAFDDSVFDFLNNQEITNFKIKDLESKKSDSLDQALIVQKNQNDNQRDIAMRELDIQSAHSNNGITSIVMVVIVVVGALIALVIPTVGYFCHQKQKRKKREKQEKATHSNENVLN